MGSGTKGGSAIELGRDKGKTKEEPMLLPFIVGTTLQQVDEENLQWRICGHVGPVKGQHRGGEEAGIGHRWYALRKGVGERSRMC